MFLLVPGPFLQIYSLLFVNYKDVDSAVKESFVMNLPAPGNADDTVLFINHVQ